MYYIMRRHRDEYGHVHWTRHTMRSYALATAKRISDKVGGYVCKLGTTAPVYVS